MVVNVVNSDWPSLCQLSPRTLLAPLLFSLYMNNITENVDSELRRFADDCVCYRKIKDIEDTVKLQEAIDRLCC